MWTLVRKTARTGEPATTEAASAPEPVETAEDEIADKADELNTEATVAEEPAALDPTKRRLELWNQSTSRKLMIQVLLDRVCSERTDHRSRAQQSCSGGMRGHSGPRGRKGRAAHCLSPQGIN